jgi:sec-independent protein translocase protein TatB
MQWVRREVREGVAAPLNDATVRFRSEVQLVDCPAMFNLSGSEIVFLLLLALIVLGPEKLPDAVRRFGKAYAEFKKMSTGFQSELKTALDEPMREMRETADAFKKAVNFDFDADGEPVPVVDAADTAAQSEDSARDDAVDEADPEAETTPTEATPGDDAPPIVRPPGPTFHSAAPQQPRVTGAVEETASE